MNKTLIWVIVIVVISAIVIWMVSDSYSRKLKEKETELAEANKTQVLDQRTNIWDIVGSLTGLFGKA